jgi:hypothetical protein
LLCSRSYRGCVVGDDVGDARVEQWPDLSRFVHRPSVDGNPAEMRSIDELSCGQAAFDH